MCPFTANSSRLSCVDNADSVQELEDTTVPSTRATLGQSDGVQKEARRGGSGWADAISLNLREVLILDKRSLARGHLFAVKVLTTSRNQAKRKLCNKKCERKNGGCLQLHLR